MRAWPFVGLAALAVVALTLRGCGTTDKADPQTSASAVAALPSVMAALGDSLTAGVGSCGPIRACLDKSWATGNDKQVDSHYARLKAAGGSKTKISAVNLAERGARAADLDDQARKAVRAKAQYVTILIGVNDACAKTMTPVAEFRDSINDALATLKKGLPSARLLVVSLPDLYRLWEIGHTDRLAQIEWVVVAPTECPSLLTEAVSTAKKDDQRRRGVAKRIDDYDRQLASACKAYGKNCRTDGGALHKVRFTPDLVSRYDYFHPNAAGQRKLADVTYPPNFGW
jgi:lysophospholipase L1-like esterase